MRGEHVGIKRVGEQDWHLYVSRMQLGLLHEESGLVLPMIEKQGGVTHVPGRAIGQRRRIGREWREQLTLLAASGRNRLSTSSESSPGTPSRRLRPRTAA